MAEVKAILLDKPYESLNRVERLYFHDRIAQQQMLAQHQSRILELKKISSNEVRTNSSASILDGFVYSIVSPSYPGWVKIGSSLDIQTRLRSYQTYSPFSDFVLSYYLYFKNRKQSEKEIHTILREFRGNGEWFSITEEQAKEIIVLKSRQEN